MPKNSLVRRQRRQSNLMLLSKPGEAMESISRATPRQVSDEDMQTNNVTASSSSSSSCLDTSSMQSKALLKRASPTPCLADLEVSPAPRVRLDSLDNCCESLASTSPWGHFVDILMQDETSSCNTSVTNGGTQSRHTKSLPHQTRVVTGDPYPVPQIKRQRLRSISPPTQADSTILPIFVLGSKILPRESSNETERLRDALKSLTV
ncbi:hypothetical protein MPSEU_000740200 [Mayamaea pseudoterrestris]|nr:hypothetical protein MPSEU_000740200 [Mayamaea pseudoterrestris]